MHKFSFGHRKFEMPIKPLRAGCWMHGVGTQGRGIGLEHKFKSAQS